MAEVKIKQRILLVEPDFPKASKSRCHEEFMPVPLLKLASYHLNRGDGVCIVQGCVPSEEITFDDWGGRKSTVLAPDQVLITSLFTYWASYVRDTVQYYKATFPRAKVIVGGVYASLMPDHCREYTGCDEVFVGAHPQAEKCLPALEFFERHHGIHRYQIITTTKGCVKKCKFCGVPILEPHFTYKRSITREVCKNKVIFYDNNLLANPHIKTILKQLARMKEHHKIYSCESQSGFDAYYLEKDPELVSMLRAAGFRDIRISWDGPYSDYPRIQRVLDGIKAAGYHLREYVYIFMIYNWDLPFEEMELKRMKCWEWQVQISDCRYRPITQVFDKYNAQKKHQTASEYHIHKDAGWTDAKVRLFRSHVRQQNICIRHAVPFYTDVLETKYLTKENRRQLMVAAKHGDLTAIKAEVSSLKVYTWFPTTTTGHKETRRKGIESLYTSYENETGGSAWWNGKVTHGFRKWQEASVENFLKKFHPC